MSLLQVSAMLEEVDSSEFYLVANSGPLLVETESSMPELVYRIERKGERKRRW